jgi:hypothetical protein
MHEFSAVGLASSSKKSTAYFRHTRWNRKRICLVCENRSLYYLTGDRYGCKRCRYNFGEFTGTFLGNLWIPADVVSSSLLICTWSTCLQNQMVHSRQSGHNRIHISIFRQAIYDYLLYELREISYPVK